MGLRAQRILTRPLDTNGDGTGLFNATGNYATIGQEFFFQAPFRCLINQIVVFMRGTLPMRGQDYGSIPGGLTNGFELDIKDGDETIIKNILGGFTIRVNADFIRTCSEVELLEWGGGDRMLRFVWRFLEAGSPIELFTGHRMSVTLNDDFTSLTEQCLILQGLFIDEQ